MPSTVIQSYAYEAHAGALVIRFVSGKTYRYLGVPVEVAAAMKRAFAKGEFFNAEICDRYRVVRVDCDAADLFSVRKVNE